MKGLVDRRNPLAVAFIHAKRSLRDIEQQIKNFVLLENQISIYYKQIPTYGC